jgi:hypothetical protein
LRRSSEHCDTSPTSKCRMFAVRVDNPAARYRVQCEVGHRLLMLPPQTKHLTLCPLLRVTHCSTC